MWSAHVPQSYESDNLLGDHLEAIRCFDFRPEIVIDIFHRDDRYRVGLMPAQRLG